MVDFILISSAILIALYLIIILISFNPADPSWLQTEWNGSIHNVGGIIGARFSDFLFFTFGALAYFIPLFIVYYFWRIYIQKIYFTISIILFEFIGLLILFFLCCSLLNLIANDFFYFSSGGIIGCVLCDWIFFYESSVCRIGLIFFSIGIFGTMLFFNRFFIIFVKITKKKLMDNINFFKNKSFLKKRRIWYRCMRYKLYSQAQRIYPTIIFKKMHNNFDDTTKNLLEIQRSSNVFLNMNDFSKKINITWENNCAVMTYINFANVLKRNNDLFEYHLNYPSLYLNHIYFNNCKKNSFTSINNCNRKINENNTVCIIENANFDKNHNLLKKNFDLINVINNDHIARQSISVEKNIYQHTFITNKKNTLVTHRNSLYDTKNIIFPDINLLVESITENVENATELKNISQLLEKKLAEYRVLTNVVNIVTGPIITRFELNLLPGMKSSKIVNLSRDLARSLSVSSVRVIEIIPGTPYVGLEIPNKKRKIVCLRDIISSDQFQKINTPLALALGQDISGNPVVVDLRRMPHLLVAGTTGSGKSVGINTMIISMLYKSRPDEVRFIMIDPKILELSIYSSIPHILKPVITDMQDVCETLQWCVQEMEHRYQLMATFGVRNLENYNCYVDQLYSKTCTMDDFSNKFIDPTIICIEKKLKKLPYIVIIIDEFSDLMITSAKKIEELIIRLTQKARAAGIHLILATQRPSVNVITGLIKANIPARIAFTVSSKIDSHTIIGQSGAESLLGMGDMLYLSSNSSIPVRVHGAYIKDQEVHAVVNFWKLSR